MADSGRAGAMALTLVIVLLYFLPSIFAWGKRDFLAVMAVNLFLGWTLIGWVVALALALRDEQTLVALAPSSASESPKEKPLLCPDCGKYSEADARFCPNCGRTLAKPAAV